MLCKPLTRALATSVAQQVALVAFVLLVALGCSSTLFDGNEVAQADVAETTPDDAVEQPTATPLEPTATATSEPSPTPTPTGITASEIYERWSPSIAFIETSEDTTGSGVLIEGGYVLTNQHVVGFAETVRVVFPNGTEIVDAPVLATEFHSDLALVGPLDTALPQVQVVAAALPRPGDSVFLLGYPDETNSFPAPTMTRGIVSRYRDMSLYDYEFIQVDALIAPGQSGGVLLDTDGNLAGISGLRFGEGSFGLVMTTESVLGEIDKMQNQPREKTLVSVGREIGVSVSPGRSVGVAVEVVDGTLDVSASGQGDISLEILTFGGLAPDSGLGVVDYFVNASNDEVLYIDDQQGTDEQLTANVKNGRYVIGVGSFEEFEMDVVVSSAQQLFEIVELDDGVVLEPNVVRLGIFNSPVDSDEWLVDLVAGDHVRVQMDSISDAVAVLRLDGVAVASGDDDGTSLFGSSVDFEFDVLVDGQYVLVAGRFGVDTGGYAVKVDVS